MMKFAALLLLSFVSLFGQVIPGRYVVELTGDPAAAHGARDPGFQGRRAAVRLRQATARRAIASHGGAVVESMDTVLNALIVNIPDDRAAELGMAPGVVRVHPVYRVQPMLDHAL